MILRPDGNQLYGSGIHKRKNIWRDHSTIADELKPPKRNLLNLAANRKSRCADLRQNDEKQTK